MPTPAICPPTLPRATRAEVEALARTHFTSPCLVGVRGYYRDSMGLPGTNDIGIYDDAIFLVTPHAFVSFNANTDPSITRPGIATLVPGVWSYKLGTHNLSKPVARQYRALVQAAPVTVRRAGRLTLDTGYFGINIHRGALRSTSSAGCQTIAPAQWPGFIALVESEMRRAVRTRIPYILVEQGAP